MAGGPSKINPPNSHPSNPIHKKATEAQGLAVKKKPTQTQKTNTSHRYTRNANTNTNSDTNNTNTNKSNRYTNHRYNNNRYASHKQGTCRYWCARFCRLCYLGEKVVNLFSPLLGDFFNQERCQEKDKQPSVFAKKGDSLTGRAKHKATDCAHQARENGAYLFA